MVKYDYTAYGECMSVTGSMANTIGQYNHIRYKGYYFDEETGFFYCLSRYYVPEWCRFLNADHIAFAEQSSPVGMNLFAYCGNNPICNADTSGHAWYNTLYDWANTILGLMNPVSTVTSNVAFWGALCTGRADELIEDFNNGCLNPFNQDATIATKSKVLSFYKGSTVFRHDLGGTCSIFGTIWANSGIDEVDLNHEFGHSVQERIMWWFYYTTIALPSASYCVYDSIVKPSDADLHYYSMPWERSADYLGGVTRPQYKSGSLVWSILENIFGLGIVPFYFAFGY